MVIHMDLKTWSCELFPCLLMVGFASLAHSDFLHCQLTTTSLPDHTLREQNDVTGASSSTSMNEPKFGIIEILPIVLQKGVLRTNCIDSRDRTNRAQIVDGLVGLGRQLKALVQTKGLEIHIEEPLSSTLMLLYEEMGDALALQFTGSAAQNKEFWKQKGQWSAMNKLTRNIQHFVSHAYMDSEKQNSPNIEVVDVCILFQILGTFPTPTGKASNLEVLAWLAPAKGK
ncbi:phosphoinositide phosphatase SAC2-like isoform X2 [Oryza glaberrima]|uniref:phosphoinositide phosphatase SAC2-like isoform X2 n=1 Tax=Oryza glaberrima TaxID=4538 RepID=UPI00224C09DB|nr:phosphoinositide phosphatase SAC2-like isoform X2 [Oryza glaberrima]